MNMNCKHVTLLVLLDLSAAFDKVDHDILLARLKSSVGINGTALNWSSQRVSLNGCISQPRSQSRFPGLGAGRGGAFSRPAPKPGKRLWKRGCVYLTVLGYLMAFHKVRV